MADYNDRDPVLPDLELSQIELESLQISLADVLIRRGELKEMTGLYPASPDGSPVMSYSHPLPKELIKELFYANDDDVIVTSETAATYIAPHRIAPRDETTFAIIEVTTTALLVGTNIQIHQLLSVVKKNDTFSAHIEREYVENGRGISSDVDESSTNQPFEEDIVAGLDKEVGSLSNPLTLHDSEKLRQIAGFIDGAI